MDGEFDTEEYILNTSKVTMPTAADMVATFGTVTWYKTRLFFFYPWTLHISVSSPTTTRPSCTRRI